MRAIFTQSSYGGDGGAYGPELEKLRTEISSRAAVLIVFDGNKGAGFSVQATPEILLLLPEVLRDLARSIEGAAQLPKEVGRG